MSSLVRIVIVALLSLAVPLQASLAYARAISMTNGTTDGMTTSKVRGSATAIEGMAVAVVHAALPADTQAEQASPAEHHHRLRGEPAEMGKPAIQAAGHHVAHPKSGNACDNCAKCCLAGAAAPPLIWPQTADVVAARVLFAESSDIASCFIPDGPERPPRRL